MSVNRVSVPMQHRRASVQGDRGKVHYGENSRGMNSGKEGRRGKSFLLLLVLCFIFDCPCFYLDCMFCYLFCFSCFCPVFGLFSSVLVQI